MTHIYVVQMDIPAELEAEFNRIYDEDHVPTILKVPGVRSCQRYRLEHSTVPSMPRYLAIYECDNAEVINSPAWIEASDTGEWKPKNPPTHHEPPALDLPSDRLSLIPPEICPRTVEGKYAMPHLFMVQLDVPVEHEVEFNRVYDTEHFPMLMRVPGVRNGARYRLEHSTVSGLQRYLTIYEIDSPDVLKSEAWEKAGAFGDWATKIRPKLTARHHSVFERIA